MKTSLLLVVGALIAMAMVQTLARGDSPCRQINPSTAHCTNLPNANCPDEPTEAICKNMIYREVQAAWPDGTVVTNDGKTTVSTWCYFEAPCSWKMIGSTYKCVNPEVPDPNPSDPNQGYHYELKTVNDPSQPSCTYMPAF